MLLAYQNPHEANLNLFSFVGKQSISTGWLSFVIRGLQPFSVVENQNHLSLSRYDPISVDILMKYLSRLTSRVEKKIENLLPSKFAIVFDGWTAQKTHYVAVLAKFLSSKPVGYDQLLFGFSSFHDADSQDAEHHFEFIQFVLSVFNKTRDNLVCMIGDNCSTNRKLSDLMCVGF